MSLLNTTLDKTNHFKTEKLKFYNWVSKWACNSTPIDEVTKLYTSCISVINNQLIIDNTIYISFNCICLSQNLRIFTNRKHFSAL